MERNGRELKRPFEDVCFHATDGTELNGWFFPAERNSGRADLVFLICHGNAGNISNRLDHCAALLETGANVFVFDYRGYGLSMGRPDEEGTYQDVQAAWRWLRQKGFAPSGIIALGESLGGAVATELAVREVVGGLILQGTFTSAPDLGAEFFPWLPVRRLARIKYDTLGKLPRIHIPVMVIHSREDGLIPFHHAEQNYAVANEPRIFWEIPGDHNEFVFADRKRYLEGIIRFMNRIETANPPRH